ncbi:hypothetical protein EVAR_53854_1 [Eumeta japonica]|uniref:Uncharacterized protein n=1 Tax=Eumeta variegata TaxID=151549 RepID=A0A4C1XDY2_EUMVA|nr:hypothetical protein EVAR_53854_1 [Eumeta japonica]
MCRHSGSEGLHLYGHLVFRVCCNTAIQLLLCRHTKSRGALSNYKRCNSTNDTQRANPKKQCKISTLPKRRSTNTINARGRGRGPAPGVAAPRTESQGFLFDPAALSFPEIKQRRVLEVSPRPLSINFSPYKISFGAFTCYFGLGCLIVQNPSTLCSQYSICWIRVSSRRADLKIANRTAGPRHSLAADTFNDRLARNSLTNRWCGAGARKINYGSIKTVALGDIKTVAGARAAESAASADNTN